MVLSYKKLAYSRRLLLEPAKITSFLCSPGVVPGVGGGFGCCSLVDSGCSDVAADGGGGSCCECCCCCDSHCGCCCCRGGGFSSVVMRDGDARGELAPLVVYTS